MVEKSHMMAELASATSKKKFIKILHEAMFKSGQDNSQDEDIGSFDNFTPLNEDDCYGIEFSKNE